MLSPLAGPSSMCGLMIYDSRSLGDRPESWIARPMHPVLAAYVARFEAARDPRRHDPATLAARPRIGGMATMPSRLADLDEVLSHVLPQVDRLHLFLHGHSEIPAAARHPRIVPLLAPVDHPYRASGKFYGLALETRPCLYFGFDDDIVYRAGHVDRMAAAVLRYRGTALVGLHGVRYRSAKARFLTHRRSYHFERMLLTDHRVDLLGVGTAAFPSDLLPIDPPSWAHGDMDDLMLAIAAERLGIKRIAVHRPRRSIVGLAADQPDSLWRSANRDDSRQSDQLALLMRLSGRLPSA